MSKNSSKHDLSVQSKNQTKSLETKSILVCKKSENINLDNIDNIQNEIDQYMDKINDLDELILSGDYLDESK